MERNDIQSQQYKDEGGKIDKIDKIKKECQDEEQQINQYISEYIETLDETEKLVLEIAKEHLESSFCIERSVGFVKWLKDRK